MAMDLGFGDLQSRAVDERRQFQRLPLPTEVLVRDAESAATMKPAIRSIGRNISGGGIQFSCECPFEVGATLSIEIPPRSHEGFTKAFSPLRGRIRVQRVDPLPSAFLISGEFIEIT